MTSTCSPDFHNDRDTSNEGCTTDSVLKEYISGSELHTPSLLGSPRPPPLSPFGSPKSVVTFTSALESTPSILDYEEPETTEALPATRIARDPTRIVSWISGSEAALEMPFNRDSGLISEFLRRRSDSVASPVSTPRESSVRYSFADSEELDYVDMPLPPTINQLSPNERRQLIRSSLKISKLLGETPVVASDGVDYTMPDSPNIGGGLNRNGSTSSRRLIKTGIAGTSHLGHARARSNTIPNGSSPIPPSAQTLFNTLTPPAPSANSSPRVPPVFRVDLPTGNVRSNHRHHHSEGDDDAISITSTVSGLSTISDLSMATTAMTMSPKLGPSFSRRTPSPPPMAAPIPFPHFVADITPLISPAPSAMTVLAPPKRSDMGARRQKMAKLTRTLGEVIPAELVFPPTPKVPSQESTYGSLSRNIQNFPVQNVPLDTSKPLPPLSSEHEHDEVKDAPVKDTSTSLSRRRRRMSLQLDIPLSKLQTEIRATAHSPAEMSQHSHSTTVSRTDSDEKSQSKWWPWTDRKRDERSDYSRRESEPTLQSLRDSMFSANSNLSEKQKALSVKRAMKMNKLFGELPPHELLLTGIIGKDEAGENDSSVYTMKESDVKKLTHVWNNDRGSYYNLLNSFSARVPHRISTATPRPSDFAGPLSPASDPPSASPVTPTSATFAAGLNKPLPNVDGDDGTVSFCIHTPTKLKQLYEQQQRALESQHWHLEQMQRQIRNRHLSGIHSAQTSPVDSTPRVTGFESLYAYPAGRSSGQRTSVYSPTGSEFDPFRRLRRASASFATPPDTPPPFARYREFQTALLPPPPEVSTPNPSVDARPPKRTPPTAAPPPSTTEVTVPTHAPDSEKNSVGNDTSPTESKGKAKAIPPANTTAKPRPRRSSRRPHTSGGVPGTHSISQPSSFGQVMAQAHNVPSSASSNSGSSTNSRSKRVPVKRTPSLVSLVAEHGYEGSKTSENLKSKAKLKPLHVIPSPSHILDVDEGSAIRELPIHGSVRSKHATSPTSSTASAMTARTHFSNTTVGQDRDGSGTRASVGLTSLTVPSQSPAPRVPPRVPDTNVGTTRHPSQPESFLEHGHDETSANSNMGNHTADFDDISNSANFRERRLRAAKLARFFGVGYNDLRLGDEPEETDLPPPPMCEVAGFGGVATTDGFFSPLNVSVTVQTDVRWDNGPAVPGPTALSVVPGIVETGKQVLLGRNVIGKQGTMGDRQDLREVLDKLREMRTAV